MDDETNAAVVIQELLLLSPNRTNHKFIIPIERKVLKKEEYKKVYIHPSAQKYNSIQH